jgi:hypothetical protein
MLAADHAAGADVDGEHLGGHLLGAVDQQQVRAPDSGPAKDGCAGEVSLHGAELAQVDQVDDGEVAGLAAEDGGGAVGVTASSGQDPVSVSRPPNRGHNVLGSSRASSVARLSLEIIPTSGPSTRAESAVVVAGGITTWSTHGGLP